MKRLLAILLFLFCARSAWATTYYVTKAGSGTTCSIGSPCLTIAIGIGKLAAGDTLDISAGTYAESINDTIPSGTSDVARTTIQGHSGDTVIMNGATANSSTIFIGSTKQYITVDNVDVAGGNTTKYGFLVSSAHDITYKNSDVGYYTAGDSAAVTQLGGVVNYNLIYQNLTIHHIGLTHPRPIPTVSIPIDGQTTCSAGVTAIFGVTITSCAGTSFSHGLYMTAINSTVDGCTISYANGFGLQQYLAAGGISGNVFKNNRIHHNFSAGILIASGTNTKAYNNIVYDNSDFVTGAGGIRIDGSTPKLYNNTIWSNNGAGILVWNSVSNAEAYNNILYQNTGLNIVPLTVSVKSGNLEGTNPVFVDTTDFRLGAGSPAIDTASATCLGSTFTTDFSGTTRSDAACSSFNEGLAWDAGAQERLDSAGDSFTVVSPNSGTLGEAGQTATFTWSATGTATNVRLRYDNDGIGFASPTTLSASTANDGSFNFTIPAAGTTYRFEVCKDDATGCDYSDSDVTITASSGGTLTKIISDNTIGTKVGDINGVEDNSLDKSNPTVNHATSSLIGAYKYSASAHAHPLIRFTGLSQIPPTAVLTSVTLGLYVQGGSGASAQTFDVRRILRTWGLTTATWNTYDGTNAWTTAGGLGAATDRTSTAVAQLTSVDLTAQYRTVTQTSGDLFDLVQNWIDGDNANEGLHVERNGSGEDSTYRDFTSSDGTDGQRPYLSVTYTVTTPTITLTQPTTGNHFYPGDTIAIRWQSSSFSGNVISTLSLNNGVSYDNTIVASHPYNQPDAAWTFAISPTISASTQAKVKVCSITSPTVCSESPAFNLAGTRR